MKRYENDIIREIVEATGHEKAPDSFSEKVMSRIHQEKEYAYSNPINRNFIVAMLIVFTVLIVLAITMKSSSWHFTWLDSMTEEISGFTAGLSDFISHNNLLSTARYSLYAVGGLLLLMLFDRFLAGLLIQGKEYTDRS